MKNLIFILLSLISLSAFSSKMDTIQAKSEIADVTVFLSGAQVSRNIDLALSQGKYLILINELPIEINTQSIQVEGIDNCKILSVKHQLKFQTSNEKTSEELEIESMIDSNKLLIQKLKNQSIVYDMEEKLLLDNSKLSNNDGGSSIDDIKEAADFYRARLNEIRLGKLNLSTEFDKINEELHGLYTLLNKLIIKKRNTYSQILITLDCEREIDANLILSYYVPSAGWEPMYDFRVDDITKPLTIVYNASVFQSSSEDWNNINITLSTSNPSLSGNKPELTTWNLGQRKIQYQKAENAVTGTLNGKVIDVETKESLPFVNIVLEQAGGYQMGGTSSDFDGNYIIKPIPPGKYDIRVTFIGYKEVLIRGIQINANQIRFFDIEMESSAEQLNEVVIINYMVPLIDKDKTVSGGTVTQEEIHKMPNRSVAATAATIGGVYTQEGDVSYIRGARTDGTVYFIDNNKVENEIKTSNYISYTQSTRVTNLEYSIEIPYTIPSDGEDYGIRIKEVVLPVDYVNYAIPKLDPDVFLAADIENWTKLDLLSGKASIYYRGTFIGESRISSDLTSDTLSVSLGRDDKIILEREGNKEMNDKRVIGNNIKETLGWDITIKNNKTSKIKIIVEDQIPISEKKSIVVELLESSNARVDEKTGKLTWEIELEPNEKRVVMYKYSVKYPKYLNLILE